MAWDNLISRGVWFFLKPSHLLIFLLLVGIILIWRNRRKAGLITLTSCLILYLLVMFGTLTNWLLDPLEQRFSLYSNDLSQSPYAGIIVLAGSEQLRYSTKHKQVTLNGAAERLIMAAKLARQFPDMPVIHSGGARTQGGLSETDIARQFFKEAGIDLNRIRFDSQSYNTHSNAVETKKLIDPNEKRPWLLVTSAFHMPRAVGAFRKAGIKIQPYPVDYRSDHSGNWFKPPNAGRNLAKLDYAAHEWLGLLTYYITDHSEALFPAP